MKLIGQTRDGKYVAEEMRRIEALRNFVLLGGRLISRLVFYGAFILGLLVVYTVLWPIEWNFRDALVLIVCIFSVVAFLLEAYNQHRGLRKSIQKV